MWSSKYLSKYTRLCSVFVLFVLFFSLFPSPVYALNRIGIRQGANGGEFYDTVTNNKFIFRGNNYYFDQWFYSRTDVQNVFTQFKQYGYNSVRIFINHEVVGNPSGGLSSQNMDNTVDLLKKAKANNLYVFPVLYKLPSTGGYIPPDSSLTANI